MGVKIDFTFCELREREVINVADGKKLGRVYDIALNCCGKILGIMTPGDRKFLKNLSGNENLFIPWCNIIKIGDDVVLVNLSNKSEEKTPMS